jgi:hypothetical protein
MADLEAACSGTIDIRLRMPCTWPLARSITL